MKKEYLTLACVWLGFFMILSLVFIASGIWIALKTSLVIFILFVLPGFSLLYKKDFLERLIFGFITSLALVGVPSYYIGLFGIPITYHFIIPFIVIAIGIILEYKGKPAAE